MMDVLVPSLCLLLWCLVEVHSQTVPYVSFMGDTLPNHAYVNLTLVGDPILNSNAHSVQCHTDLNTCCGSDQGRHRGDWYFPDGTRLQFSDGGGDIYESRGAQRVDIRRNNNANSPSGIYRCDIPTNDVYDENDNSVRERVYIGLYATGGKCEISIATDKKIKAASTDATELATTKRCHIGILL